MAHLSLAHQRDPLAKASEQRQVLLPREGQKSFERVLAASGLDPVRADGIQILQVNLGRVCNQTCTHCHVDAGPDRRESMDRKTAESCLRALEAAEIPTLEITAAHRR